MWATPVLVCAGIRLLRWSATLLAAATTHQWRLESRRKRRRFWWPIGAVWTWKAGKLLLCKGLFDYVRVCKQMERASWAASVQSCVCGVKAFGYRKVLPLHTAVPAFIVDWSHRIIFRLHLFLYLVCNQAHSLFCCLLTFSAVCVFYLLDLRPHVDFTVWVV